MNDSLLSWGTLENGKVTSFSILGTESGIESGSHVDSLKEFLFLLTLTWMGCLTVLSLLLLHFRE